MDATSRDLVRQIVVIAAVVYMLVAAFVGVGLLGGTPVEDLQGGALAADGSYLAPAGPAFSIWSVIYVLVTAYAVWQALPSQRTRERQRALGWWVAVTAVLNGTWLVLAQFTTLVLTVVGIVLLLVALCATFVQTIRFPAEGVLDSVLIDGVTGLHLGWVSLATVANIAAWLTAIAPASWADSAELWGVVVLIVVGAIGVAIAWASGWRVAPGIAMGWGLSWLAVGRLQNDPSSGVIGVTAIVVAVVVVAVPVMGTILSRAIEVRNAEV